MVAILVRMSEVLPAPTGRYHIWTRADRLRVARESLEVSQEEFADRLDVGRNTISRYESLPDGASVKANTIKLWAMATGFDYGWLMTGDVPITPDDGPSGQVSTGSGCIPDNVFFLTQAAA